MAGILKGLHHLYKNRVMHRDLKPENIMIRKENMEPVIIDFGLSTNVDLPEYPFFRCGTPGYLAPEIIRLTQSIHLEPTCDVFSLGAIFHILLTGKPLFPGVKYDEVYRANKEFDINFQAEIYSSIERTALNLLK
jgi:serine/threonine protein kinase